MISYEKIQTLLFLNFVNLFACAAFNFAFALSGHWSLDLKKVMLGYIKDRNCK